MSLANMNARLESIASKKRAGTKSQPGNLIRGARGIINLKTPKGIKLILEIATDEVSPDIISETG